MVLKFAVLVALVLAALCVLHVLRVIGERAPRSASRRAGARPLRVEETRRCRVCGTYVLRGAAACGRPDCPLARSGA